MLAIFEGILQLNRWAGISLILCIAACASGQVREPAGRFLTLETGGATGDIHSLAYSHDGRYLISCGTDKVARVWDMKTSTQVQTLRGAFKSDYRGELYAVATSYGSQPLVATAGLCEDWQIDRNLSAEATFDIRIFDYVSGALVRSIPASKSAVYALAFSPTSQNELIAGALDGNLSLLEIDKSDKDAKPLLVLPLKHDGRIEAVGFSPDGRLLVSCDQRGNVALWNCAPGRITFSRYLVDHRSLNHSIAQWDTAYSLAWRSDGGLAVGFQSGRIDFWNNPARSDMAVIQSPQKDQSAKGLAFSADGTQLWSGGITGELNVWSMSNLKSIPASFKSPDEQGAWEKSGGPSLPVYALASGPAGVASGGVDGEIFLWQSPNLLKATLSGGGKPIWSLAWSEDSRFLGFSADFGQTKEFESIYDTDVGVIVQTHPGGSTPSLNWETQWLSQIETGDRQDAFFIDGKPGPLKDRARGLDNDEFDRSVCSLHLPAGRVALGTNFSLFIFSADYRARVRLVGHTGPVTKIALSPDRRWLASCSMDRTVRIWKIPENLTGLGSVGEVANAISPVLSLYSSDDGSWVAWHPNGYFSASPEGENCVGLQYSYTPDEKAEFVPILACYEKALDLYRPGVLVNILSKASDGDLDKALNASNKEDGRSSEEPAVCHLRDTSKPNTPGDLSTFDPPPTVEPTQLLNCEKKDGQLYETEKPSIGIKLFFSEDAETIGYSIGTRAYQYTPVSALGSDRKLAVGDLAPGEVNQIHIVAKRANEVQSPPITVDVLRSRKSPADEAIVYAIGVGIDKYKNPAFQGLQCAAQDASSFRNLYERQLNSVHSGAGEPLALTEGNATKIAIIKQIELCAAKLRPQDKLFVLLAGHGMELPDPASPTDAHKNIPTFLPCDFNGSLATAITADDLSNALKNTSGKISRGEIFIYGDFCYSGHFANKISACSQTVSGPVDLAVRSVETLEATKMTRPVQGFAFYPAVSIQSLARESAKIKHGIFTFCVLMGLAGNAANAMDAFKEIIPLDADLTESLTFGYKHSNPVSPDGTINLAKLIGFVNTMMQPVWSAVSVSDNSALTPGIPSFKAEGNMTLETVARWKFTVASTEQSLHN